MDLRTAPPISQELVEYLDALFPDRCPDVSWNERKIWFVAGCVYVVRHLKQVQEEQCKTVLEK